MSLSVAIPMIVIADLALIALLTFVMSRAARLEPHAPRVERSRPARVHAPHVASAPRQRTRSSGATAGSRS
jgi:hypothetical protein